MPRTAPREDPGRPPLRALVLLTSVLLVGGVAAAGPASAAGPRNCPQKHVCLFDGANWSGAMKQVGCSTGRKALGANWSGRATSVINRCSRSVAPGLAITVPNGVGPGEYEPITIAERRTIVGAGQWANLGGKRQMDNAVEFVTVR